MEFDALVIDGSAGLSREGVGMKDAGIAVLIVLPLLTVLTLAPHSVAGDKGFIENQGQHDGAVLYYARSQGYDVYFLRDTVVFDLKQTEPLSGGEQPPQRGCAVWVCFEDANPAMRIEAVGELPTRYNYLLGNDQAHWQVNVPCYAEIVYLDVWPGVNLVYQVDELGITYRADLSPDSDPGRIGFSYRGADCVVSFPGGSVEIETPVGSLFAAEPGDVTYGEGLIYRSGPAAHAQSAVGRAAKDEDALLSSTYLGGAQDEYGDGIVLDAAGNAIVTGKTYYTDFPTTPGAYDTTFNWGSDVFVSKFAGLGGELLWSTFVGGNAYDCGHAMAIDALGNPVVTGYAGSSLFPITSGAYDTTFGGSYDAFILKLSSSGDELLWSTFLGGSADEYGYGIALDSSGNPVLSGMTKSSDYPTTTGAHDESYNGDYDVYASKVSADGSNLLWSTYVGGVGAEYGFDVVLDQSEHPILTGWSKSSDFPVTPGAFAESLGGEYDAFVAKLTPSADDVVWASFLGGNFFDTGNALAVDATDHVLVVGKSAS
jgi:hypothetical protein